MKTFVGEGQGSISAALEKATAGLTNPSGIIFYAPYEEIGEAAAYLQQKYPGVTTIGTIGTKFVNGSIGDKNVAVTAFFQDAKIGGGIVKELDACPIASIAEITEQLKAVQPGTEDTVCIEFCTNDEERLVTTMNAAFGSRNISLVGGTAFGAPEGKKAVVACNGQIYENACAYIFIKNTTGKVKVFKENIYEKRSNVSHYATKVDVKKKSLIEIDNQPAAAVYSREVGVPREKIVDNVFKNPIGRSVGDEVYISSMMALGANGELINYKRINKNDCIYFLELGDFKESEVRTRNLISSEMKHISLVFSVDCIYRYLLYGQEHYVDEYAKGMASLGAHVGIVGGGEQFNNQHVNQTMVCAVFE